MRVVSFNSLLLCDYWMIHANVVTDVLLRCLESLERKASDSSDQQETSAALKEVSHL